MHIKSTRIKNYTLHLNCSVSVLPGGGRIRLREGLELILQDGQQIHGYGEAAPLEGHGVETLNQALNTLKTETKFTLGRSFSDIQPSRGYLLKEDKNWSSWLSGFHNCPCARFAMETALLDLFSSRSGLPLSKMLYSRSVSVVSVGVLLGSEDISSLANEAKQRVEEGFCCLKVKLSPSLSRAEQQLSCIRKAIGSSASLRVDVQGRWNEDEVLGNIEKLAQFGLEMVEQPVGIQGFLRHPEWRSQSAVPLGWDYSSTSAIDLDRLLGERMIDILVLKPHFVGGVLRSLSLVEKAIKAGISVVVTTAMEGVVGRMAALHMACVVDSLCQQAKLPIYAHGLGTGALMREDLMPDPCPPKDGQIEISQRMGLGLKNKA